MSLRVHVVGAGLAGLSAAVRLAGRGVAVTLYEAAPQAGGRCRSFRDGLIEREIDNGNHLVLRGNRELMAYVAAIGAAAALRELRPARFAFLDLASGAGWRLEPGGRPWWALEPGRLPPGIGAAGLAADLLRLAFASADATVGGRLDRAGPRFERLWAPLTVAALNTEAGIASARALWAVVRETLLKGEAASRPLLAPHGLTAAFVAPALATLRARGAELRLGARLRAIETAAGRVVRLGFAGGDVDLDADDRTVLAVPPAPAQALLPGLPAPAAYSAILNAHFVLPPGQGLPAETPFLGLLGGTAEWLFQRADVLSVTVSAANRFAGRPEAELAALIWRDAARALGLDGDRVPPARLIVEKRATPAQVPAWERERPGPMTGHANLVLAGDWTRTGVPATLEGAVRSGHRAAEIVLARL